MATVYSKVIKETALRINGIAGSLVATVETNYASASTTTTELDNPRYPPAAIKDAVLDAEALIALAVANCKDHPWRQYMVAASATVNNGGQLPTVDNSTGRPYIGVFDPPYISATGRQLEQAEYGDVRAYNNDSTYFGTNPSIYALRGDKVFHTQSNGTVVLTGCSFERSAQATALAANGNILFPDMAVPLYWSGAVSLLTRDGEYSAQAAYYQQYFQNGLAAIANGQTAFQPFAPEPPAALKASV